MLGHTLISFLINGTLLLIIGIATHYTGYLVSKPDVSRTPLLTFILLSLFTYAIPVLGYVFSIVVAGYLIWRENKLYKIGATAFLVALVLTAISLFIGNHLFIMVPIHF